jgi:hypothetical protein
LQEDVFVPGKNLVLTDDGRKKDIGQIAETCVRDLA